MDTQDRYTDTGATGAPRLGRLSQMDDYKVADGYPDIRGWEVKTADGRTIGKVDDLIADTGAMRVRYVDVELDRTVSQLARDAATPGDQERHTLLPIGNVRLDDAHDDVLVDGYTLEQVAGMPRYSGASITPEYERSINTHVRGGMGAGAAAGAAALAARTDDALDYEHDAYDDQRLYAARRARTGADASRLTLSEEQLSVGKRAVEAGEVAVHKTVETEHVTESVPLTHEEVTVERHRLSPDARVDARIGEDEIRVPLMREEAVAEKRVVPREEIIVRKQAHTEQQNVEADLRRERLDTTQFDEQARLRGTADTLRAGGTGGAADRATNSGPLDRAADKLDDMKDRIDGNPASRPGPDATDRPI